MTVDSFYTVLASFVVKYSKIQMRESEKSHLQQYTVVSSVKLHWHSGISNFIVRLRLYKVNTLSLLSAVTANSEIVY